MTSPAAILLMTSLGNFLIIAIIISESHYKFMTRAVDKSDHLIIAIRKLC